MPFGRYLNTAAIRLDGDCANRKKVLETVAALLSTWQKEPCTQDILKLLMEREKLGSTGLGHGIAVPHCRIPGIAQPRAAVLRVHDAVDFDAPDNMPVSLFCALIVDIEATEEHLQIFADLVRRLNDETFRNYLMNAQSPADILSSLTDPPNDT